MWLLLFMPWATIGAFGCAARNSFHTDACVAGNSAFNTTLSGTSNSLNNRPTRATPVPVVNQIRTYWWCSPPRTGRQRMVPASLTARRPAHPSPKINASLSRCDISCTTAVHDGGVARRTQQRGQGIPCGSNRSAFQHMCFAMASAATWVGRECPLIEVCGGRPHHRLHPGHGLNPPEYGRA